MALEWTNIILGMLTLLGGFGWIFDHKRHKHEMEGLKADNRKPFDQLFFECGFHHPLPQANPWAKALEMARWAPSAANGQPWRAVVDGDSVHFYEAKSMKDSPLGDIQKVDVGIALAHFDMTLEEEGGKGTYSFSDPGIPTPENTHYIVTWRRI